ADLLAGGAHHGEPEGRVMLLERLLQCLAVGHVHGRVPDDLPLGRLRESRVCRDDKNERGEPHARNENTADATMQVMPSFDVVSQVDRQEVKNAVEQTNKEIQNRFDFKGSDARVELSELVLTVYADDEFKLGQVMDVLRQRLAKRNVDVRSLDPGAIEKISGDKV